MQFSRTAVTPSDEVDMAWHFHMTNSKSYYDMCKGVFGRFIHHNPTKGGEDEGTKYKDLYNYTLILYEKVLGEKPSGRFWPSASKRFSQDYTK